MMIERLKQRIREEGKLSLGDIKAIWSWGGASTNYVTHFIVSFVGSLYGTLLSLPAMLLGLILAVIGFHEKQKNMVQ